MIEDRDPILLNLFAEAQEELADEAFVDATMARTRSFKLKLLATIFGLAFVFLMIAISVSLPVLDFALFMSFVVNIELIPLGETTLGWLLTPVNNIAALLVVLWRGIRFGWSRARNAAYS